MRWNVSLAEFKQFLTWIKNIINAGFNIALGQSFEVSTVGLRDSNQRHLFEVVDFPYK